MKKKLLFSLLITSNIIICQNVFFDDFQAYTSNSMLSGQGIWTNNSSNPGGLGSCAGIGCVNTQVKDYTMSFPNYGFSNKAIYIAPNGDATGTVFSSISSGSVYFSFLVNFSDAVIDPNNSSSNDFFRVMGGGNYNTLFRLNAFKVGSNFVLALQKESGTKVTTNTLNFNTTYLVVLKYTFNPGATDDVVSMYINPNFASSEPTTPTVFTASGSNVSEFTSIDRLNFRTNWSTIPTGYLGIVNIATSWNILLNAINFNSQEPKKLTIIPSTNESSSLHINYDNEKYKNPNYFIYSLEGKLVANGNIMSKEENTILQIPSLSKGIYIFVLEDNQNKESQKFIF